MGGRGGRADGGVQHTLENEEEAIKVLGLCQEDCYPEIQQESYE